MSRDFLTNLMHSHRRLVLLVSMAWLLMVGASLTWSLQHVDRSLMELALNEARFNYEKDVLYLRWSARHGGVYVPVTEETPSNSYLAHIPERDIVTPSGRRLTLVNPAYLTRQVHQLTMADGVIGHITSLKPLRPENRPDAWERLALTAFERGVQEYSGIEPVQGEPHFRYMRPFPVEAECLPCHAQQGYKIGDIRGGISISLPFSRLQNSVGDQRRDLILWHGVIGLMGLIGIGAGARRLHASHAALLASEAETERLTLRKTLLSSLGEGVYDIDSEGRCGFINPAALTMLGYREDEVIGLDPHWLFHRRKPDGSPHPISECPVFQTQKDGLRRGVEDIFTRKNGLVFPVRLIVTPVHRDGAIVGAVVAFEDISQRKAMEEEMLRLATTDPLTGAANRRRFLERLEEELARVRRYADPAALLMLDLDHFKQVNDAHGHAAGDLVLRHFTDLARPLLRRTDLFGRLGGEEFGVLLTSTDLAGAMDFAERFRLHVAGNPTLAGESAIPITVSTGVTEIARGDEDADRVLARADEALYRAKRAGRNAVAMMEAD